MIRFVAFILIVVFVAMALYVLGKSIYNLLTKSQASSLEEDLKKGEKAKETIKQLSKKIK